MTNPSAPITLPEYESNPLIANLPPLKNQQQIYLDLRERPHYNELERTWDAHLRKHCIMRLSGLYEPMAMQLNLAERFNLMLCRGYVGRNPTTKDYLRHLQAGAYRIQQKDLHARPLIPVVNTASSFALVGSSGMGKTRTFEKILHQYPQVIEHTTPFVLTQIVWIKLECPHARSHRQLCIDFFAAIDNLIGTNYSNTYGRGEVQAMLRNMAHISNLHALGALVIDEIQYLRGARSGSETLMDFLVSLVNTIGVPLVLIGTMSALPVLQDSFRNARRASGFGSPVWERMQQDGVWEHFLSKLWPYQWTDVKTELTPELSTAIYEETQGVIDLVVKLYQLVQIRRINLSVSTQRPEEITVKLIKQVAKDDFRVIKPMIDALRTNNKRKLAEFDDLRQFHVEVSSLLGDVQLPQSQPVFVTSDEVAQRTSANPFEQAVAALKATNIAEDVARVVLEQLPEEIDKSNPLLMMQAALSRLTTGSFPQANGAEKKVKKKQDLLKAVASQASTKVETYANSDLRNVVFLGKSRGLTTYESLNEAGLIRFPLKDFAY